MSESAPSHLPHASGANVDLPRPAHAVEVSFDGGQWYVCKVRGGNYGLERERRVEIGRDVVVALANALGLIHPDVVDRNYAMWAEALLAWQIKQHRRAVQGREVALLEARKTVARTKARTRKLPTEGKAPNGE